MWKVLHVLFLEKNFRAALVTAMYACLCHGVSHQVPSLVPSLTGTLLVGWGLTQGLSVSGCQSYTPNPRKLGSCVLLGSWPGGCIVSPAALVRPSAYR